MIGDEKHDADFKRALAATQATLIAGIRSHPPHSQAYWLRLSIRAHVSHAAIHLEKYLLDLQDEDHLVHAFCRLLFAVEIDQREREHAAALKEPDHG
jgi:hypothetical protein